MSDLRITNLVVSYGRAEVLHGISLRVARGETVALVGRNGAGKTTLLQAIYGFVRPNGGSIEFRGHDLLRRRPHERLGLGVSYVPEDRGIFRELTVLENLRLGAPRSRSDEAERLAAVFDLFPTLNERAASVVGSLSGGQQQMVGLGRALMSGPELLLLDEPSLGLAPKVLDVLFETLGRLGERGVAILVVEQNVRRALSVAHRGYLLNLGRISMEARAEEILADGRLEGIYLGIPGQILGPDGRSSDRRSVPPG